VLVAAGILASRIVGLVRGLVFARYFSTSAQADAFTAALRIPNLLQNLFGEGVLSASFIPVYAGLLSRGERDRANRVAGAVFALLSLVVALLVLAGVLATPVLIELIAPGFQGATRELTIRLVRILFPGAGLLVLSAWCLGILNSHRRFFLSYVSPVIWNVAIIVALLIYGPREPLSRLAVFAAWGSVVGCGLQFVVQLPTVFRLAPGVRPVLDTASAEVRQVIRSFLPAFVGRGAYQLSAYADMWLASKVAEGAVAALGYAQNVYMLPVSLFGMAVSAAELPAMSSASGDADEVSGYLRTRLDAGLRQIAYFVVPSAVAFAALGQVIAAVLYRGGRFGADQGRYVWVILAGAAVGLLASTLGRLYSSTYYALKDTRTPLRFALVRVALTIALGYVAALVLPGLLGLDRRLGAAGLTASAGVAGWVEFALLRGGLNRRIGRTGLAPGLLVRLWGAAALAAAAAWGVLGLLRVLPPRPAGVVAQGTFAAVYLFGTYAAGVPQAKSFFGRLVK
jgi:putative peptidoglycan lipid II flippase